MLFEQISEYFLSIKEVKKQDYKQEDEELKEKLKELFYKFYKLIFSSSEKNTSKRCL